MYRYRRVGEARAAAREAGFRGAMFPWQSGSEGIEETQRVHLNPVWGRWEPDLSRNQRHVNATPRHWTPCAATATGSTGWRTPSSKRKPWARTRRTPRPASAATPPPPRPPAARRSDQRGINDQRPERVRPGDAGQPVIRRLSRTSMTLRAIQAASTTASCSAQVQTWPVSVMMPSLVSAVTSLPSGTRWAGRPAGPPRCREVWSCSSARDVWPYLPARPGPIVNGDLGPAQELALEALPMLSNLGKR